jgi:ABC-type Mn2+/Zn2+ transport system ATPase subunit
MNNLNYALIIDNLTVRWDEQVALKNVSWRVPAGTLAAVIGPNGGGKTTLLKSIIGLLTPQSGKVLVLGQEPAKVRHRISYLPQEADIDWKFPISVIDVVLQGCLTKKRLLERINGKDKDLAYQALDKVGLLPLAKRSVQELSGGQKQRVLLARALAQQAEVIILDEPTTALDASAQHDLLSICNSLRQQGCTIIATTHDLNCLTDQFDQILGVRNEVICQGKPQENLNPETLYALFHRHVPFVNAQGEMSLYEHN